MVRRPTDGSGSSARLEQAILDAGTRCIRRWGVAKTSLDDIAREAGCSRATEYRIFPGGRASLWRAIATREVERFFETLSTLLQATGSVEDLLVAGFTEASVRIRQHAAPRFLLMYDPDDEVTQPLHASDVVAVASEFAASHLERFLPAERAHSVAELSVRLIVSYLSVPSDHLDPSDESAARDLVRRYVLPVVTAPAPTLA
jgi:AcrR family transcriptional regulator